MSRMSNKLKSIWPYNKIDSGTWKYIDCHIAMDNKHRPLAVYWLENPDFRYSKNEKEYYNASQEINK